MVEWKENGTFETIINEQLFNGLNTKIDENKAELWLVGYSELKDKGLFLHYRDELKKSYFIDEISKSDWQNVLVFQHFSMNRFTIDLKNYMEKNCTNCKIDRKILRELGKIHRNEIFGD